MFGGGTEHKIAELFQIIAEYERSIEISRQVLSDCYDFCVYQIFNYLDQDKKNCIDYKDIIDYLRSKGIFSTDNEARLLILFYDQDFDGSLTYNEFINLVQSEKTNRRPSKYTNEKLSFNVDYSLGKLLEKEIELARIILDKLVDIQCRHDFNVRRIFHSIGCGFINSDKIREFLIRNGISFLDSDIRAIMKRLDLNRDGRVDLNELNLLLCFPKFLCCNAQICHICCCVPCNCHFSHCHCIRSCHSPIRNENQNFILNNNDNNKFMFQTIPRKNINESNKINDFYNDNNRYTLQTDPRRKNFNENINTSDFDNDKNNNLNMTYSPPRKLSESLTLRLSPKRTFGPQVVGLCPNCKNDPCQCSGPSEFRRAFYFSDTGKNFNFSQDSNEEKLFCDFLKKLMEIELEIERKKQQLASFNDFNCEDVFRLFENYGKGEISMKELKEGFELIKMSNVSEYELRLFMKRFDLQKKGKINYADFFDIIVPFEQEYRNKIEQLQPNSNAPKNVEVFSKETLECLKKVFNTIIFREIEINELRKKLGNLKDVIKKIYNDIDFNKKGYFSNEDFVNYLKRKYLYDDGTAADLLFIRLDKNRDGNIVIGEIEDEITPLL